NGRRSSSPADRGRELVEQRVEIHEESRGSADRTPGVVDQSRCLRSARQRCGLRYAVRRQVVRPLPTAPSQRRLRGYGARAGDRPADHQSTRGEGVGGEPNGGRRIVLLHPWGRKLLWLNSFVFCSSKT